MARNKLTDAKAKGLKKPGVYGDGDGLYLRVHPGGSKSWFFIYRRNGIRRELGLGSYSGAAPVTLTIARRKADELRTILAEGGDPYAARNVRRKADATTFRTAAEALIETRSDDWSAQTLKEWRHHLLKHAGKLADVSCAKITTELVEEALLPIWTKRPATGQRVREKVEAVLSLAEAKRWRSGANPARWADNLEHVLPKASRTNGDQQAALHYKDVPGFLASLDETDAARCLRLVILTAVRSGATRFAKWSEFDLDAKLWTIPVEQARTKTGKELIVPLSDAAIATLGKPGEGLVFRGMRGGPIGNGAMSQEYTRPKGITVHGFRAAFKTWCDEQTHYAPEIAEWALGHDVGGGVERAYRRGDALEKRRALMADWAAYCVKTPHNKNIS